MSMRYGTKPLDPALGIRSSLLEWLDNQRPQYAFAARSRQAARKWQRTGRAAFAKCLGSAPPTVPRRPKILERRQMDGYHRTTLTLNTAPHIKALCWLCMPDELYISSGKTPAMVVTPGHGMGAKDLLAMDERGRPRREGRGYQKDYALQVVRLGYPALVIEPLGFGERRDASQMKPKSPESGCQAAYALAIMLGTTLPRLRANDLCCGLDYLETIRRIDARRVGLMGISGGGQMTLWTAALEPRFKLAIVSGYLNSFRTSIMAMYHCICNFAPELAQKLDMTDLAALVAPRPLLIESGTRDPIFPIRHTRAAITRVRQIYKVFNAQDRVDSDIFVGDHQWSGRRLKQFLRAWL